jgi:hypothetical protein
MKTSEVLERRHCPAANIGRVFGAIGDGTLEGSLLSPDYCIVYNGECTKHQQEQANDN